MKASQEFVVGKNSIGWVGSNFEEHFYDMSFTSSKVKLKTKILSKQMLDKEIFAEFKPQSVQLGDVLHFLSSADKSGWYIFYVNDAKGILWAVHAFWDAVHGGWDAVDGGWDVEAISVESPRRWLDGDQVVSREFLDTEPQILKSLETLPEILEVNGVKYKKI